MSIVDNTWITYVQTGEVGQGHMYHEASLIIIILK